MNEEKAPTRSWLVSYRRRESAGYGGGKPHHYDEFKVIDEHPTLWLARENSYSQYDLKITRVYSAIEIPPDDVQKVIDDLSGKQSYGDF